VAKKSTKFEMALEARNLAEELKVSATELPLGRMPTSNDRKDAIEATLALLQQVKATGKSVQTLKQEEANAAEIKRQAAARDDLFAPLVIDTEGLRDTPSFSMPSPAIPATLAELPAAADTSGSPAAAPATPEAPPALNINKMFGQAFAYWAALAERAPDKIPTDLIPADRGQFHQLLRHVADNDTDSFQGLFELLKELSDKHAPVASPHEVRFLKENLREAAGNVTFPADVQQIVTEIAAIPSERERMIKLRQLDRQVAYRIGNTIRQSRGAAVVTQLAARLKKAGAATTGTTGNGHSPSRLPTQGTQTMAGAATAPEVVTHPAFSPDPGDAQDRQRQNRGGKNGGAHGGAPSASLQNVVDGKGDVRPATAAAPPPAPAPQPAATVAPPPGQAPAPPSADVAELVRLREENAKLQRRQPQGIHWATVGTVLGGMALCLLLGVTVILGVSVATNRGGSTPAQQTTQPGSHETVPATFDLPPLYPESPADQYSAPPLLQGAEV